MKQHHKKIYKLPRSAQEIRINNYNPVLLLWKANIDLQFVGESSLAVAQYVTGYVTKAERSNMQDLWQEVSSHSSVYSKLFSFVVRSLLSRECGLYEASDLLLGDHLCGKSQTIKWIDVSQPQHRRRRLIHHSKLMEMREKTQIQQISSKRVCWTRSSLRDQARWRMSACMTLLPSTPSPEWTKMVTQCTANSASPSSLITSCTIPARKMSERNSFIPSCSCLSLSVMRETSLRRGRLLRVPLSGTCKKTKL